MEMFKCQAFNLALDPTDPVDKAILNGGAVPYCYVGASQTALTSGTLTVGKTYIIDDWITADDFTNVGGSNVDGTVFVATGTTPTTWTNSSSLRQIGCVLDLNPSGITETEWIDRSGNNLNGTVSGAKAFNLPRDFISPYYGVSWDEVNDTYERTGLLKGEPTSQTLSDTLLPIQAAMRRCVLNAAGEVQYYLYPTDSTKREDGVIASDLTGGDGQVMVQIPKFYYGYAYTGTTHTWNISLFPQSGLSVHPAFIKNGEVVDYRYYSLHTQLDKAIAQPTSDQNQAVSILFQH